MFTLGAKFPGRYTRTVCSGAKIGCRKTMQNYKNEFIEYAIQCKVLRFGEFRLKSGRLSPYFFNTGLFRTGVQLGRLGHFYAQAYRQCGIQADVLYGPAYKGIPLVCATTVTLADKFDMDIPFAFNRKETKDHGEGGNLVGAPLIGNILILDDVITAGTSVRESVKIIRDAGANPCGVLIALDRQELGKNGISAIDEVRAKFDLPVVSIISLADIVSFLKASSIYSQRLPAIEAYRIEYGC